MTHARFVFTLALAAAAARAQQDPATLMVSGEIHLDGGAGLPNELSVELEMPGRPEMAVRTGVAVNGSFEFRQVAPANYLLKVQTPAGETLEQQYVQISPSSGPLNIRLRQPSAERPPDGRISVGELLHPVAEKARKKASHAARLSQAGDHQQAAAELEDALRISPYYIEARNNLGVQYVLLGRNEEAAGEFRAVIETSPGMAAAHGNLSYALFKLGRLTEAEEEARRAIAADRGYAKAHFVLGLLLSGKPQSRTEAIRELNISAGDAPAALLLLARLYAASGDDAQAAEQLRRYRERAPQDKNTADRWESALVARR